MRFTFAATAVSAMFTLTAFGQAPAPPPPKPLTLARMESAKIQLGHEARLRVTGLSKRIENEKLDLQSLVLVIDGRAFPGLSRRMVSTDIVAFDLKRTTETRDAWAALLGRPSAPERRNVGIRLSAGAVPVEVPSPKDATATLVVYNETALRCALIGMLALLALFIWLARTSNIIRDSAPPKPPAGKKKPYSLARLQMAFWFFLVIAAFIFLWVITLTHDTLTPQALTLIGIGSGTALGAAVIETNKRAAADTALVTLLPQHAKMTAELAGLTTVASNLHAVAQASKVPADIAAATEAAASRDEKAAQLAIVVAEIADAQKGLSEPVSTSFLMDILTDTNGISFHRFQMFVWTIVLGAVFIVSVWNALAMPPFNETLLALLGISAGTYLGFKVPERQQ
ncbi:MAG TPA: hypothetical protein VE974_29020 [Thermoanaerobaculia bacterium]|nr:hypothetical protein [Thermoanaerobaculia bacterium]